jgi:hypothetical protein
VAVLRQSARTATGQAVYDLDDTIGQAGMESFLEPVLRGKKGFHIVEVDINRRIMRDLLASAGLECLEAHDKLPMTNCPSQFAHDNFRSSSLIAADSGPIGVEYRRGCIVPGSLEDCQLITAVQNDAGEETGRRIWNWRFADKPGDFDSRSRNKTSCHSGLALRAPRNDGDPPNLPRDLQSGIGVDDAAIDRDRVADHKVARARGKIDRNPRHVFIGSDASPRNALCDFVCVIARGPVHVRPECTRWAREIINESRSQLSFRRRPDDNVWRS